MLQQQRRCGAGRRAVGRRGRRRDGGGQRAELVNADTASGRPENQRRELRIDAAYRAWVRNRGDVEALRELHAALGEQLSEQQPVT
jgi:hypothetical protein